MADKKRSEEFTQGKERLDEIGRRLGSAFGTTKGAGVDTGGLLGGLGNLISQLGRLAEQAEQSGGFSGNGESEGGSKKPFKAVYGFSVKSGMGADKPTVEPFGNVHRDSDGPLPRVRSALVRRGRRGARHPQRRCESRDPR